MLFYIALAVACVIAAVVCLWLYRLLSEAGHATYLAFLPGARDDRKNKRFTHLNPDPSLHHEPRYSAASARRPGATAENKVSENKVPWGWPGSEGLKRSNMEVIGAGLERSPAARSVRDLVSRQDPFPQRRAEGESLIGWPYRKDTFETEDRKERKQTRSRRSSGPGKPWGW